VGFGGRISERRIPANEQGSRKKPEEARVSSTITGEAASGWEEGWPANSAPLIACGVQPGRSSRHEVADCLDC